MHDKYFQSTTPSSVPQTHSCQDVPQASSSPHHYCHGQIGCLLNILQCHSQKCKPDLEKVEDQVQSIIKDINKINKSLEKSNGSSTEPSAATSDETISSFQFNNLANSSLISIQDSQMSISPSIAEKSKDDTQKAPSTVTHSENAQSTQNNSLNSYDELIDLQNILPDENRQK